MTHEDDSISFIIRVTLFIIWRTLLDVALRPGRFVYSKYNNVKAQARKCLYGQSKKRVVVIGGGFAGTEVAKNLQKLMDVHLIDTKEFFEFTPSVLRTIVNPEKVETIQIHHKEFLPQTNFHHGTVEGISPETQEITYIEHETKKSVALSYDYLIISSGSSYHRPFKNPNVVISTRAKDFVGCAQRVISADSVVIIGGGYVGVELAAELIIQYPNKQITIIHSGERLLSRQDQKSGKYAEEFFKEHGVKMIFNENVVIDSFASDFDNEALQSEVHFTTTNGTSITANLAFICTGIWPNSGFLGSLNDKLNILDEKGFVSVNDFLQIPQIGENVFVCGDVADLDEEKLAQAAGNSATVVVKNILNSVSASKKKKHAKLHRYIPKPLPIVVSLGKYDAIFSWHKYSVTGFLPALIKEAVEWKVLVTY